MRHCTSCGAALLDGFRFCVQCGATVEPIVPVEAVEPTPAAPVAEPVIEAPVAEAPVIEEPAVEAPVAVSGMPEYIPEPIVEAPIIPEPIPTPIPEPAAAPIPEPVVAQPVYAAPVYAEPAPVYSAPVYAAPAAEPAVPAAVVDERNVLGFGGAFVALLLFCIPGINLITAFIWAVGGAKNRSRRSLSRAYLLLILAFVLFFGCMGLLVWLFAKDQVLDLIAVVRDAAAAYGIPF